MVSSQKLTHKKYIEDRQLKSETVMGENTKMSATGNNMGDDLATLQREVNDPQKSELHSDDDTKNLRRRDSKAKFKALQSIYRVFNKESPNSRDIL